MTIRAILTDIEGTTSSINFVHEVLFPYASEALPGFVREHAGEAAVAALLDDVRREAAEPDADVDRVADILLQWIAEDRKATPLKALQGRVWEHGYARGDFTGHLYEDAARKLGDWAAQGISLYVYSSGSVQAQELLFGHSDAGDVRHLFSGYFDTRVGHKRELDSYRNIAASIGLPPADILFLSDVVEELDAARAAGMQTVQLVRDDRVVTGGSHRIAHDFDEVMI